MASISKTAGTVVSTGGWSNFTTTRLGNSDNSRATTTSTSGIEGVIRNFAFNLPASAVIRGIIVWTEFRTNNVASTATVKCRISKDGGSNWSSYDTAETNATTSDALRAHGSSTDMWGLTLTPSEVNDNTNFRVAIWGSSGSSSYQCQIDYVYVQVYYDYAITVADSLTLTDDVAKAISSALSDGVTLSDEATVIRGYNQSFSDGIVVSDSALSKQVDIIHSDAVTLSEEPIKGIEKLFGDTLDVSDDRYLSALYNLYHEEGVILEDSDALSIEYNRGFDDVLSMLDERSSVIAKEFLDTMLLEDLLGKELLLLLGDLATISDEIAVELVPGGFKIYLGSEQVNKIYLGSEEVTGLYLGADLI